MSPTLLPLRMSECGHIQLSLRAGESGGYLRGWSCSAKAKQIQVALLGVVDFKRVCDIRTAA